jgi:hypothetical protein
MFFDDRLGLFQLDCNARFGDLSIETQQTKYMNDQSLFG